MDFGSLTAREFEQMIHAVAMPDFHDLTTDDFFAALTGIGADMPHETLELTASVTNGQLTFLEPAPLHAHGNEIRLATNVWLSNLSKKKLANQLDAAYAQVRPQSSGKVEFLFII